MNRSVIRAMTLVLCVVFSVTSVTNVAYAQKEDDSISETWMENIFDDTYLSEISIPGTHDSGTHHITFGYFMRCQNTDISKQLKNGYRYLDVRLAIHQDKDGQRLNIIHSFAKCHKSASPISDYLYLDDVLEDVYSFLDEHPTETVILNMKIESKDEADQVQKLLYDTIDANESYWYTDNTIPTLGEVRGKAVLCTRFEDSIGAGESKTGIQLLWEDQGSTEIVDLPYELSVTNDVRLWVQDRYNYDAEDKYAAVVDGLENCEVDSNTLFLNFVSTSGKSPIGHPKGYAKDLNKLLLEYEFMPCTNYGIVIVDFGNKKLAEKIYTSNFSN